MTGRLEARVEFLLQILPKTEAVRTQHDASAHGRVRYELRLEAGRGVPCGEVGRLWRNLLDGARCECVGHDRPRFARGDETAFAGEVRARASIGKDDAEADADLHSDRRQGDDRTGRRRAHQRRARSASKPTARSTSSPARSASHAPRCGRFARTRRARGSSRRVAGVDARRTLQSRQRARNAPERPPGGSRVDSRRRRRRHSSAPIDEAERDIPALANFIHPGGSHAGRAAPSRADDLPPRRTPCSSH